MSAQHQHERRSYLAALLGLAIVAVIVHWPAMRVGAMSDDFMQLAMVEGQFPGGDYTPFDLYGFLRRGDTIVDHIEQGTAPWWSDPELHGTVLRPIPSALRTAEVLLLPHNPWLWHLHSMAWLAACVVTLGLALRRLMSAPAALLAVTVFAFEAGLSAPLAWLANRCVLICATFGFLAIWAHIHWRRPNVDTPRVLREHGALIVCVLMSLCIASGEYGLGILAYLVAWEGLAARGSARTRARALLPSLVPVLAYLIAHKSLGYGTFGAEVYVDPFHSPTAYLGWVVKRLPKLIAAGFWSIPGATIHVFVHGLPGQFRDLFLDAEPTATQYRHAHLGLAWLGVVLAGLVLGLSRRALDEEERRSLRVLVVGGVAGLLPIAVAPAHSRLLVVAQLASCGLVALALVSCLRLVLAGPDGRPLHPRIQGLVLLPFAALLAWSHVVVDAKWGRDHLDRLDLLQASNMAAFAEGDLLQQKLEGVDVVMLNGPSQTIGMFGPFVLYEAGLPVPKSWRPLALGSEFPMVATRPDTHTLDLWAVQGGWLQGAGELFFRKAEPGLPAGTQFHYPSLDVEVLEDEGGRPTRVRFTFDRDLDDPTLLFVAATKAGLNAWQPPPVGGRGVVPLPRLPSVEHPDRYALPRR